MGTSLENTEQINYINDIGQKLAHLRGRDGFNRFEEAIALDPHYATAWSNKGWALSDLGRHDQALAAYDQSLSREGNSANTWYNRGVTLYQLQLDTEAIASFEKALEINPNYQPALDALEQLK